MPELPPRIVGYMAELTAEQRVSYSEPHRSDGIPQYEELNWTAS
jgi:hypothetical protein